MTKIANQISSSPQTDNDHAGEQPLDVDKEFPCSKHFPRERLDTLLANQKEMRLPSRAVVEKDERVIDLLRKDDRAAVLMRYDHGEAVSYIRQKIDERIAAHLEHDQTIPVETKTKFAEYVASPLGTGTSFGPRTFERLVALQAIECLEKVDGKVGGETLRMLESPLPGGSKSLAASISASDSEVGKKDQPSPAATLTNQSETSSGKTSEAKLALSDATPSKPSTSPVSDNEQTSQQAAGAATSPAQDKKFEWSEAWKNYSDRLVENTVGVVKSAFSSPENFAIAGGSLAAVGALTYAAPVLAAGGLAAASAFFLAKNGMKLYDEVSKAHAEGDGDAMERAARTGADLTVDAAGLVAGGFALKATRAAQTAKAAALAQGQATAVSAPEVATAAPIVATVDQQQLGAAVTRGAEGISEAARAQVKKEAGDAAARGWHEIGEAAKLAQQPTPPAAQVAPPVVAVPTTEPASVASVGQRPSVTVPPTSGTAPIRSLDDVIDELEALRSRRQPLDEKIAAAEEAAKSAPTQISKEAHVANRSVLSSRRDRIDRDISSMEGELARLEKLTQAENDLSGLSFDELARRRGTLEKLVERERAHESNINDTMEGLGYQPPGLLSLLRRAERRAARFLAQIKAIDEKVSQSN